MVMFDDRQKAFEEKFKHEEELRFKVAARGNRLFGGWAAGRLGLSGPEADDYARSVVHAQFDGAGVVAKVDEDFRAKGVAATEAELQSALAGFAKEAQRQIMAE